MNRKIKIKKDKLLCNKKVLNNLKLMLRKIRINILNQMEILSQIYLVLIL